MNEFTKITSSPMMNTQNVYRYSGTKLVEQESLAQHIVDTMMLGYIIVNKMRFEFDEDIDVALYLEKALHHDMEESMTGDVVRTLKYHNPGILKEMQDVAKSIAWDMYDQYFTNSDDMYMLWYNAKSGKEGFIVKVVDILTVANKAIREIEFFGNMYFLRVAYEVMIYLQDISKLVAEYKEFNEYSRKYLTSIIQGAIDSIESIMNKYLDVAQEYNIVGKSLLSIRKDTEHE